MLTLLHHTTEVHPCQFSWLEALLAEPFRQTPNDLLQLEQRLSAAAAQVADQMVLAQLTRAHEAGAFVAQALAHPRAQSPVPLVHKGFRTTSVLLLGGTRLILETPYLRQDRPARGTPRWGRPCVSPCLATGPWRANACGSASTAAACASAAPIVGGRRPRGATGFPHRGVSPGCW